MTVSNLGVIVIGRNEGARLVACFDSLPTVARAIYVDSGSTDDSVRAARAAHVEVVELPAGTNFTAALARNAGLQELAGRSLDFVQMIDGDCTLADGWLDAAILAMQREPELAVVFGRRRERYPTASVYNRLCDHEWDGLPGYANSCGGDALFRLSAVLAVQGYAPDLIAGEEPDLCLRLRAQGWLVRRLPNEMTTHDAAMHYFAQWWRRSRRGGHAFAELWVRHGEQGDPGWRREVGRIVAWTCLPGLVLLLPVIFGLRVGAPTAIAGAALYCFQIARIIMREIRHGTPPRYASEIAIFLMLGKYPQLFGVAGFFLQRWRRVPPRIIEYKTAR